jgi:predicted enzyme related to lactoylglutathione lyase
MHAKNIELVWITVSDLQQAKKFYTETLGLKANSESECSGWVEIMGTDGGAILGLAQYNQECSTDKAGSNAVVTFSVDNIEQAKADYEASGVIFQGPIIEVPGHVKIATFTDKDGNKLQLVQVLSK